MGSSLLSLLIFTPIIGAVAIMAVPIHQQGTMRFLARLTTGSVFCLSCLLLASFDPNLLNTSTPLAAFDPHTLVEATWIPSFHIYYRVGVDGLSVLLVVLTGLLSFLAIFATFNITKRLKAFYALYLLLVTGMIGVFVSLDFFLFFVFWELVLIPVYFLIGIWGGQRRVFAAVKFFIFTLLGSVLIFLVMIAYYLKMTSIGAGEYAFHIPELIARQPFSVPGGPTTFQQFLFWALFIGFAIKIPVFPFHTWLPDAHVEAPTAISVILAGVLLKIGAYGLLRLSYPLVPEVAGSAGVMWFLAVLGVVNIVYGALCTLGQSDFKRLVAYSSISHMGYVLLGIATLKSEGINGAIFQMFAHGISSAMMFLIVGVLYDRARHREVSRFGGIGLKMPVYFALTIISFFASLGLPSTIGFIGQLMVLLGAFSYHKLLTAIAASGMLLTAGCFIWTLQRVYSGEPKAEHKNFDDCNQWELAALAPLAAIAIIFGIIPSMVIGKYLGSTEALLETFTNAGIL